MWRFVPRLAMSLGLTVLVLCATVATAHPRDPILGAWKLNLDKSKFATPAPKSQTVTMAPATRGYVITIDAVAADGQSQTWSYTSTFDGSESVVAGNPAIDAVVATSNGTVGTVRYKKAGKTITTTESVMSDDLNQLTVTIKIPVGEDKELTSVAVYDRQ